MTKGDLSYKYQRLRERLRSAVKTGELAGKLPGERELARRYAANAKTINKALNDLAMEGLVLRHVGRGTFVAGSGPSQRIPTMPARTFAWIAPKPDAGDGGPLMSIAAEMLQSKGHRLENLACQADGNGELAEAVLSPRTLRQVDGVLLVSVRPSRELLANLRRRHLPVVLVNNHHPDIRLPAVLTDQSFAAFSLATKCVQLGHTRVQLLLTPDSLPAAAAARMGYESAMQYVGLAAMAPAMVTAAFDWSSLSSGENRPTALICVSGALASETRRRLAAGGLTTPADVSIAAICLPGESRAEKESISGCEFDARQVLHWATEFINEGLSPHGPQVAIVPGRYRERGSIAPPAARRAQVGMPVAEARL